jgi:outer membrane protein TolC
VGEGIPIPADVPEAHADVTALVREAQANRLEVHAIDETTKALNKGASATRASTLPHVDAVGDYTYANPNQRYFPLQQVWHGSWSAGVQATWTLGDAFLNSAAARELEANAKATQAQRTALRAGIANEVLTAYLDVTRAQAAFQQQKVALAAAEEGYRVTTDLFKAGRATSTDLVLSEGELLDAKLGDVNARIDLTLATIALRHATARDLPRSAKTASD